MTKANLTAIVARHAEGNALSCGCGKCAAEAHSDRGELLDLLHRVANCAVIPIHNDGRSVCPLCLYDVGRSPNHEAGCPVPVLEALR